jgi:hypothetical protein
MEGNEVVIDDTGGNGKDVVWSGNHSIAASFVRLNIPHVTYKKLN